MYFVLQKSPSCEIFLVTNASYSHVLYHNVLMWNQTVDAVMSALPPVLRGSQVEQQRGSLLKGKLSRTSAHVVKLCDGLDLLQLCSAKNVTCNTNEWDGIICNTSGSCQLLRPLQWTDCGGWLTFIASVGSGAIVYLVESPWLTVGALTGRKILKQTFPKPCFMFMQSKVRM